VVRHPALPVKRPKTLWFVFLFVFVPSLGAALKVLWQQSASDEYRLFAAAGITMWLQLLAIASVMLNVVAIRYLWRPEPVGLGVGLASLAVNAIVVLLTAGAALVEPETLRTIVTEGHARAGRSMAPEVLEFTLSPRGLVVSAMAQLAFCAFCAWLLYWNRDYFKARTS
jgi:hypothetical protein